MPSEQKKILLFVFCIRILIQELCISETIA